MTGVVGCRGLVGIEWSGLEVLAPMGGVEGCGCMAWLLGWSGIACTGHGLLGCVIEAVAAYWLWPTSYGWGNCLRSLVLQRLGSAAWVMTAGAEQS